MLNNLCHSGYALIFVVWKRKYIYIYIYSGSYFKSTTKIRFFSWQLNFVVEPKV